MKNAKALLSVFVLVIVATPFLRAADRMTPGNWTFEMKTTDQDSRTFTRCVTADEAGSVNGDTASARAYAEKSAAGRCTLKDFTVDGDTVSYSLACSDTTISSKAAYHGDHFEGVLITKNGDTESTTQLKAHRVGACP
jgi:hypothetical protein